MGSDVFKLLCPFQITWMRDPAPLAMAEKSRRIGWTWTHALKVVLDRLEGRGNYYHSSADQTASVEFIDYCGQWGEMVNAVAMVSQETEVIDEEAITTKVMTFANGTKIVAGSSNPKFFRSKGGEVGLDEFAFHAAGRDLYKAAHATAMFWGFPLRIWSTHNGDDCYFAQMLAQAKAGKLKASLHRVTIEDAVRDGIVERIIMRKKKLSDVPAPDLKARQEWLDELRATCPDDETWNEEYMCMPSTGGRSLLSYELIAGCVEENLQPITNLADFSKREFSGPLYAGYDVGRTQDLSVLWVLEKVGDVYWTRVLVELQGAPYADQQRLLDLLLAHRQVKRLCIDKGLIGGMLAELLEQRYGKYRVEGVQFSTSVQSELAMPFRAAFEDRSIRIPGTANLREDLHKPKKIVVGNNVRFETPRDENGHADRFWAGALAMMATDRKNMPLPAPLMNKPMGW